MEGRGRRGEGGGRGERGDKEDEGGCWSVSDVIFVELPMLRYRAL